MGLRADHAPSQNRSGRAVTPTSGREMVAFYPVPEHKEEPPEDLLKSLSKDQKILLQLALAVQSGSSLDTMPAARPDRSTTPDELASD